MLPVGECDASVVRTGAKSGAIIAALGATCGLARRPYGADVGHDVSRDLG